MKKIVLKTEMNSEKCKRKVLQTIAGIQGVDSVSVDLKEKRITVIGDADPVVLTNKLRKCRFTELVSVSAFREEQVRYSDEIGGSHVYGRRPYSNSYTPPGGFHALTDGDHYSY
ncbi:heavy metal-associated isoprenylated plant protein 39 [Cryptomeria japonica]|uniref:heavy metal-associated isoprenylated plant protein 39 n=1 Tax=Cryptomeria japonica TaxID=3369 RepID=UPI0027D9E007|nr:heavy metal-associated isoprenylated plant protein 39 [Cryptomeria japonica]